MRALETLLSPQGGLQRTATPVNVDQEVIHDGTDAAHSDEVAWISISSMNDRIKVGE
jgi:hypothetical protein